MCFTWVFFGKGEQIKVVNAVVVSYSNDYMDLFLEYILHLFPEILLVAVLDHTSTGVSMIICIVFIQHF